MELAPKAVSDLIGRLYDAALDPGRWPGTLDDFRARLGFEQAALSLQEMPSGRVMLNETAGMQPEWAARIPEYAADIVALWGGAAWLMAQRPDDPVVLSHVNPEVAAGTCSNRYYREWRKPQGLIDTLAVKIAPDTTSIASASLIRHERQGPIESVDVERMRLFAPHLRRAIQIGRLLDPRRLVDDAAATTLERLGTPVLLVDAERVLLHANEAGARLLETGTPLRIRSGRVEPASLEARRKLADAVRGLLAGRLPRAGEIGLAARNGHPLMLHLIAVKRGEVDFGPRGVLIAVSGMTGAQKVSVETIGLALGMTRAQAAVFQAMAEARSTAEAAERMGIAVSTLRSHLVQIYAKCGLRGQGDLVDLAARLRSPFGG